MRYYGPLLCSPKELLLWNLKGKTTVKMCIFNLLHILGGWNLDIRLAAFSFFILPRINTVLKVRSPGFWSTVTKTYQRVRSAYIKSYFHMQITKQCGGFSFPLVQFICIISASWSTLGRLACVFMTHHSKFTS